MHVEWSHDLIWKRISSTFFYMKNRYQIKTFHFMNDYDSWDKIFLSLSFYKTSLEYTQHLAIKHL